VSAKTVERGEVELKRRSGSEVEFVKFGDAVARLRGNQFADGNV
jgi:hypothetical protein